MITDDEYWRVKITWKRGVDDVLRQSANARHALRVEGSQYPTSGQGTRFRGLTKVNQKQVRSLTGC